MKNLNLSNAMQGNVSISVGTPLKCYFNFLKNLHKLC